MCTDSINFFSINVTPTVDWYFVQCQSVRHLCGIKCDPSVDLISIKFTASLISLLTTCLEPFNSLCIHFPHLSDRSESLLLRTSPLLHPSTRSAGSSLSTACTASYCSLCTVFYRICHSLLHICIYHHVLSLPASYYYNASHWPSHP